MNLVQIQERLKDLPTQAVMAYANGSNPQIPPYVALGELKRRESMEKDAAMHQQAQKGPQPTVKDQVEQQVGLMSLQRQQQQQMAQNQAQQAQRQPQPVPPGIPQPATQPEPEPEMAMAMGGVAALPVKNEMFEYNSGGIIAFAGEDGSQVPAGAKTPQQFADEINSRTDLTPEEKSAMIARYASGYKNLQGAQQPAPRPAAPAAPARAGLPAAIPDTSQSAALANQLLGKEPQRPTAAGIVQEEEALRPEELKQPYGAEAKERIAGLRSLYEKQTADRPYERLLSVLGGMARGSLGGAGPAYLQSVQAERAADLAQAQRENEALSGIEKAGREEAKDIFGKRSDMYKSAMSSFTEAERNRLTAAVQKFGYDTASADRALDRINNMEMERIRVAAMNKPGETERLLAKYADLKTRDPAAAEEMMKSLERIKGVSQRAETAKEKNQIARQKLAAENFAYGAAMNTATNPKADPVKRQEAIDKMKAIEKIYGIEDTAESAAPPSDGKQKVIDFSKI